MGDDHLGKPHVVTPLGGLAGVIKVIKLPPTLMTIVCFLSNFRPDTKVFLEVLKFFSCSSVPSLWQFCATLFRNKEIPLPKFEKYRRKIGDFPDT